MHSCLNLSLHLHLKVINFDTVFMVNFLSNTLFNSSKLDMSGLCVFYLFVVSEIFARCSVLNEMLKFVIHDWK